LDKGTKRLCTKSIQIASGSSEARKAFSRKGAKAQRNPFRNAVALCAFAREIFSVRGIFLAKLDKGLKSHQRQLVGGSDPSA
jgi:hypothetical protein